MKPGSGEFARAFANRRARGCGVCDARDTNYRDEIGLLKLFLVVRDGMYPSVAMRGCQCGQNSHGDWSFHSAAEQFAWPEQGRGPTKSAARGMFIGRF
jgi:hypothetical protein